MHRFVHYTNYNVYALSSSMQEEDLLSLLFSLFLSITEWVTGHQRRCTDANSTQKLICESNSKKSHHWWPQ